MSSYLFSITYQGVNVSERYIAIFALFIYVKRMRSFYTWTLPVALDLHTGALLSFARVGVSLA